MDRSLSTLSTPRPLPSVTARSHGLLEAPRHADDGGIVVTGRGVVHVDGEHRRELLSLDGVAGFNDVTTDSNGQVLAGALRFQPFAGEDPVPTEVWRITAPGVAEIAAEGIDWPNGIALTPDDSALYVSDTANDVGCVFTGGCTDGDIFASVSTGTVDGLALDEEGVWVALGDGGIARFDADGNLDGFADVPSAFVSSLCFGGPDRRDVYITTADNPHDPEKGGTVFHARAEVAGVEVGAATV